MWVISEGTMKLVPPKDLDSIVHLAHIHYKYLHYSMTRMCLHLIFFIALQAPQSMH